MMVKVLLLIYLGIVAAHPKIENARKLQSRGAAVAEELLAATGSSSCSVVFITDGSTSSFIVTKEWQQWRGAAVFQTDSRNQKNNVTHYLLKLVPLARQVRQLSWCTTVVVVSHDPVFLAAFAEWSLRGRLLVWSTRLLVVTRLALPQLRALLPAHWTFSMMNTVFLNVEGDTSHMKCVGYTFLPYSPGGAKVEKVSVWTPERGLDLRYDLFPFSEKFANFYGEEVFVTALPFMPFWGEVKSQAPDGSSVISFEGSDYQLLVAVATTLNFTIRVLPSDSWGHATKQVAERRAFMCTVYHIVMTVRAEKYDFTFTYEYSYLSFGMAKPGQQPQWQSLYYPLAQQVWVAVMVALIFFPIVYRADMTGMLLGQNLPRRLSSTSSSRVMVAAWVVFALILGLAYRCNLTASLTLPKYPPRPETIPQLVDAVERITIMPYGDVHLKYYRESESPLFNALARLLDVGPSVLEGLTGALKYKRAHLAGKRFLKYQIAQEFTAVDGSSRLYVGRDTLYPGASGWPIPHDAPYKAQLDRCIMTTMEAGLYEKWVTDLLKEAKLQGQRREQQRQDGLEGDVGTGEVKDVSPALTITHTQGAFILLLLGMYIAVIAIVGELLLPPQ